MYTKHQGSTGFRAHIVTLRDTQSSSAQQCNILGSITCSPSHGTATCKALTRTLTRKKDYVHNLNDPVRSVRAQKKMRRHRGRFVRPTTKCTDLKIKSPVELFRGKQSVTQLGPDASSWQAHI